ncbi:hypothetical protein MUK42_14422 [Musa troglodytarum]|uniref:Uncharacterized protein n=1 Tax=Musa troglodytarum TaxID=320322 RepID=A0A9E7LE27_9LILI|nr:hypothetical protein MUK42_14422 [Musa troglodytarum]URE47270.1 hypothetical protein MUK42_14422 [Musa troglodytarum]URE47271.1 hypothetical protein MUK42_14422 [Musa troglodytarum]URE47272.1 hypothetical protein MUK42_14422 [Musa troglodytarum]URE47273.1 hypothetical protein MUK42_14422 [Musa troglodytarum]
MKDAAAAAVAPKLSKKNSDDEEPRKKKKKIKSNKRRRLRHSSCSSSDSDDGSPRSRRKRAKRLEKRKRGPKNDDRKKKKKKKKKSKRKDKEKEKERSRKSRYRSVSASSRSCSTCRGRSSSSGCSVSRSPPPRAKPRARSRSRGRGRDGDAERGRGRRRRTTSYDRHGSRYRSRSCSTCGGSRSSGPTGGSACRSRSCSEEKYGEIEQPRRLRSVLAMAEDREVVEGGFHGKDEQRDRIIQTYDDFDRYDGGRKLDTHQDSPQRNAKNDEALAKDGNANDDGALAKHSETVLSESGERTIENADGGGDDFTRKKKENSGGPEAVELESELRQRALENFAKFRRSLSVNTRSSGCQEDDSSQPQCGKDSIKVAEAQDAFKSSDDKFTVSHECQGGVQGEVRRAEPRVRSVVNIPAEKDTSSLVIRCHSSSGSTRKENEQDPDNSNKGQSDPNQLNRIEEPSNKMSLQHTSLIKDKQEKSAAAEPECSTVCDAAVNQSVGQPTSALPADRKIESENENKDEDRGSQFQQKTFSRMRDGELVQVSYKVYIPKKSPALARRQLQR